MKARADHAVTLFAAIAAHHGVAWTMNDSPKFGSNALRVNDKIYAALTRKHRLLLKLPPARIAELLAAKGAERFQSGGRVMNGWVVLTSNKADDWIGWSNEARAFLIAEGTKHKKK